MKLVHGVSRVYDTNLEGKADSELCLERNTQGLREASSSKEVNWLAEIRLARHILELVSVVAGIENVESLKEQSEFHALFEFEELRNANVQLRETVSPLSVDRQLMLIVDSGINRLPIVVHTVAIDVANASREDAVWSGRS